MFHHKKHITQEEYDKGIADFYELGLKTGRMVESRREWDSQAQGLSFPEKQVLVILEREEF